MIKEKSLEMQKKKKTHIKRYTSNNHYKFIAHFQNTFTLLFYLLFLLLFLCVFHSFIWSVGEIVFVSAFSFLFSLLCRSLKSTTRVMYKKV